MMLSHLGEDLLAKKIEDAVSKDLAKRGQTKRSTFEIGDAIAKLVNS
jgi:3-isopropylmalate dehydrogenase